MKKPTLVVMAAGMGSRFGGLKQMTPIDPQGNSIIQYSLYDARLAGFDKVVFIIKHEIEHDFREKVGRGVEPYFDVSYVFQELTSCLPQGFTVPEGRTKPWGTGHAVLCARGVIDGPFAVINSDDFYGRGAFTAIGGFLTGQHADNAYAMVGYRLHNAMTEHGSVARGVCELRDGYLTGITERTHIEKRGDDAAFTEDGEHFTPLSGDTTVSMNFWGFTPRILDELAAEFPRFLQESVSVNPLKAEFYLPTVANNQLAANRATVRVLHTDESWHGVTYREDLASVQESVAAMHAARLRFRPIMMTTAAAILGAVPLALGQGDGAEIRQPLGITIVGGLLVSQLLTLYTTPVVYLCLDRARLRWRRRWWRLRYGERKAALLTALCRQG